MGDAAGLWVGDSDAIDQLVELAGERGDLEELRGLADRGNSDAVDVLVELAGTRGDRDELRRLATGGNQDAAEVLAELDDDAKEDEGDSNGVAHAQSSGRREPAAWDGLEPG